MITRFTRRDRTKLLVALGALLGCALLTSAIAVTTIGSSSVRFSGEEVNFRLAVAAGEGEAWRPGTDDWVSKASTQGRALDVDPYNLSLGHGVEFVPGEPRTYRIAVKNESTRLPGVVTLTVSDPGQFSGGGSFATAPRLDLLSQLQVSVESEGTALSPIAAGSGSQKFTSDAALAPGASRIYQVTLKLPADLDKKWYEAAANVQFRFDGESR